MTHHFFRRALYILLFFSVLIGYMSRYTNSDLLLADAMYSTVGHAFLWRDNWFATVFMHRWAKYVLIVAGLGVLGLLMVDVSRSIKLLNNATRKKLAVVGSSFIAIPAVISVMKSQSIHHCPWDLQRYGGYAPYLRLFDVLPEGVKAGHCFPAGHASSGWWLAACFVFWLPRRPRMAALVFILGLLPGFILGWGQQLRGAHFLTHTLWSAWIASLIIVILARLLVSAHTDTQRIEFAT